MSIPILPLAVWQSGTNENSLPANDNALRLEALSRPWIGTANDAPPSPEDGDVYLVGMSPTGDFASFDPNDIAIFKSPGSWYAWAPVDGLRGVLADVRKVFIGGSSGTWVNDPSVSGGGGEQWVTDLPVFYLGSYGATIGGDNTAAFNSAMDDLEAAGGGIIQLLPGGGVINGALQDTGRSNAQLVLPIRDCVDDEQIVVWIRGALASPSDFSVIGPTPIPDGFSYLESTLTTGSGGSLLGGWGPSGSAADLTNIHLVLEDVGFRMPDNPTHTAVDASHVACMETRGHVLIDTGSFYIQGLPEPTTSTSYGLRFPRNNNGAFSKADAVSVCGFYYGYQLAEHVNAQQLNSWGCKYAAESVQSFHSWHIDRFMDVHCTNGIQFTGGISTFSIDQYNIERATSGWWTRTTDIDDSNNYGRGHLYWHCVEAGVGIDDTFVFNGGLGVEAAREGFPFFSRPVVYTSSHTLSLLDSGKFLSMNCASPSDVTVPPQSSVPWMEGAEVHVRWTGAAQISFIGGSGVTITQDDASLLALANQGAVATLKRLSSNTWALFGRLEASP